MAAAPAALPEQRKDRAVKRKAIKNCFLRFKLITASIVCGAAGNHEVKNSGMDCDIALKERPRRSILEQTVDKYESIPAYMELIYDGHPIGEVIL